MSEQPRTQPDTAQGRAAEHVRIVLVGDDGLDASVREDATFETVRPRTPLEAVGEVASPPASARGLRTIVVVDHDGEPDDERDAFVSALRLADPGVKLVRVGPNGQADTSRLYDAVLGEPATSASLRRLIDQAPARAPETESLIEMSPVRLPGDEPGEDNPAPDHPAHHPARPRGEHPAASDDAFDDDPPIVATTSM